MSEDRIERFIESLEIVTARMLEMTVANNQLAASQTPEMRELFGAWVKCMADELLRYGSEGAFDVRGIAEKIGLSPNTVISLLVYLSRRGDIEITSVTAEKGQGKNSDICDCLRG
ncbi:hypothetical protein FACS1894216_03160 [Synergistales bacterium]|nr:hypothetical protein FACS1894216_03160 [Synergistales bacterium]